jgi:tetratricopeptide (TPR) repeat protein
VTALLSLAQAYVENQQAEKAVQVLENEDTGPLALLENKHPATNTPGLAEETYKTALRAYISSLATVAQSDTAIEKAKSVMERMKTTIGSTSEGQQRLVAVYVSLARELESQLKQATPEARAALSKGFATFLRQLSTGASELNVLNWVAETFLSLGGGFDTGGDLSPESKNYYEQAVATFDRILAEVPLEEPMKLQIRIRKAEAMRRMRQFKDALDTYEEILRSSPSMLNVQVDAALTYQQWGDVPGKEPLYLRAITGHRPDPATKKNIVWGWGKIAQVTAPHQKFRDTFHQARYSVALCRLKYAESLTGTERTTTLNKAVRDISLTKKLYGLGDDTWTKKYDELLKRIQTAQGSSNPQGIRALEPSGNSNQ